MEKKINQGTKRQKKKKKSKVLNCLYTVMLAAWIIKQEKLELLTYEHKFDLVGTIEAWWQDSSDWNVKSIVINLFQKDRSSEGTGGLSDMVLSISGPLTTLKPMIFEYLQIDILTAWHRRGTVALDHLNHPGELNVQFPNHLSIICRAKKWCYHRRLHPEWHMLQVLSCQYQNVLGVKKN